METFIDLISRWKDNPELAGDIGVKVGLVACWKHRDSVPAEYWPGLVQAAKRRGWHDITYEALAKLYAAKRGVKARAA